MQICIYYLFIQLNLIAHQKKCDWNALAQAKKC